MALFGKNPEKAAAEDAAKGEVERLNALALPELAVEMMPAFGPDGPKPAGIGAEAINFLQVSEWMLRAFPNHGKQLAGLRTPVREGLALLERSGLIEQRGKGGSGSPGARMNATRLGHTALEQGTVAEHVGAAAGS